MPKERTLFEHFCLIGSLFYTQVWQFDEAAKPIKRLNPFETEGIFYNSLERISLRVTVRNSANKGLFSAFFPTRLIILYYYQTNANLLSKLAYVELNKAGQKMRNSFVKAYNKNGLPLQQQFQDGTIVRYELLKPTDWKRTASLPQLP